MTGSNEIKGISFDKLNDKKLLMYIAALEDLEKRAVAVRSQLTTLGTNKRRASVKGRELRLNIWLEENVNNFIAGPLRELRSSIRTVGNVAPKIGAMLQAALK